MFAKPFIFADLLQGFSLEFRKNLKLWEFLLSFLLDICGKF